MEFTTVMLPITYMHSRNNVADINGGAQAVILEE